MWIVVGLDEYLHFCSGFSLCGKVCQDCQTAGADSGLWAISPVLSLLGVSQTAHLADWVFCLAHPWLATCQSTSLSFFDSIKESVLEVTPRTGAWFDLFHLLSRFHWWQAQQALHSRYRYAFCCSQNDAFNFIFRLGELQLAGLRQGLETHSMLNDA